jgi:RNA polymerase sigma-70 factor, ECF subfamily
MAMETLQAAGSPPGPVLRGRDDGVDDADAALIQRVATADRNAMRILFSRHHLAVYRFVMQRLQDKALAEDVTSEVFLGVWRNAPQFQGRSAVLTWILAIARYKTLAARPKSAVVFGGDIAAAAERIDDPEVTLQVQDRKTVLRRCLTRLSAEHREVIDLVYYQEQSMESVATILGIPRSTAKTRVFYARKRLADELRKSGVDWVVL